MPTSPVTLRRARCACGSVVLEMSGEPIIASACYCDDCQEAARQIAQLPGATPVMDSDGGTPYLIYRKDRMTCVEGAEHLHGHRLKPASPTRRVIAGCCNSAMYLDFEKGHWYSIHRRNFDGDMPAVQMHVQTKFKPGHAAEAGSVQTYAGYPPTFMMKLVAARVAMLFHL
ncbi:MAG: DUF6151 family protein [Dokdonella sp.]